MIRDINLNSVKTDAINQLKTICCKSMLELQPFIDIVCNKHPLKSITISKEDLIQYGKEKQISKGLYT